MKFIKILFNKNEYAPYLTVKSIFFYKNLVISVKKTNFAGIFAKKILFIN